MIYKNCRVRKIAPRYTVLQSGITPYDFPIKITQQFLLSQARPAHLISSSVITVTRRHEDQTLCIVVCSFQIPPSLQLCAERTTVYDPVGRNPCPGIHCTCTTRNVFLCDNTLITTRSDVNLKTSIVRCESLITVSNRPCCRGQLRHSVLET